MRVFAIIGLILALFGVTIIGMSPRLQPQPAAPVYSVGVLLLGDTADSSWNTAHCEGLARAADELGLRVEYEENVTPATCREAAERLIAHGCNIIVSTSIAFEPGIVQAAQAHHSISFLQATGTKVLPNLTPYMGRMYQARSLAGLVAGRTSRSGAIGYVATTDIPEVVRGTSMPLRSACAMRHQRRAFTCVIPIPGRTTARHSVRSRVWPCCCSVTAGRRGGTTSSIWARVQRRGGRAST